MTLNLFVGLWLIVCLIGVLSLLSVAGIACILFMPTHKVD